MIYDKEIQGNIEQELLKILSTAGEDNAMPDMDAITDAERRSKWAKRMHFNQAMNDASLKRTIEKHLLEMGKGKVSRVKVFLTDERWTVVVNQAGTPLNREMDFHFIFETGDGAFFIGRNSHASWLLFILKLTRYYQLRFFILF